jgi:hypothetical protein
MRLTILALLLIQCLVFFPGCTSRNPITLQGDTIAKKDKINSYDPLELLTQTDCHFMGIKVITILPGKLKAQFEDEKGIYFYADNFKNATNTYYSNAGIFIPKNGISEPFAFAHKGSLNSLAVLSCDTLNFNKTK